MEILLTLLIILIITIYIYCKNAFTYWSRQGVAQGALQFPFGNVKQVILRKLTPRENILNIYKQLKVPGRKFAGTYFFTKPEFLILDPELMKTVMIKDFQYFSDRPLYCDDENEPLVAGLFALNGNKWRNMRQKVTPAFTSRKLKMMFPIFLECGEGLSQILEFHATNNQPIDIIEIASRLMLDFIGNGVFGFKIKDPDNEFQKWAKKFFEPSDYELFKKTLKTLFPGLYKTLRITKIHPGVKNFFKTIVQDAVDYRRTNNIKRNDFLQLLINIQNPVDENEANGKEGHQENSLTLEQITAMCMTFIVAGFETSSKTISFFLYDVAVNQEIQDKVRKEINSIFNKYNGVFSYEGIMDLEYMDKVLNESMRQHTLVFTLTRRCVKDYKVPETDNLVIKAGTTISIPVIGVHNDPEYYPNPEKFDPERFSPEESKKRNSFTFLPFGDGPRNCVGMRYGLLQTKLGIAMMLKNHRFTLNNQPKVPFKYVPMNSVEEGIWLNVERIKI